MLCVCEMLLGSSDGRRIVSDANDALLVRGCRRAANCDIMSSFTSLSFRPSTSGSTFGCRSTGGGGGGTVIHGLDFDRGNDVASIKSKCAPHASVQEIIIIVMRLHSHFQNVNIHPRCPAGMGYLAASVSPHCKRNTNTHNRLTAFSRTTWVGRYQKDKPFWILLKQEMTGWQWLQLNHMQIICTSLQTDNHASISSLQFFTGRMPFLPPNQRCQSTEGKNAGGIG